MKDFAAENRASRDALLARVRRALGRNGADDKARADAQAYVAAHAHGPRPKMPSDLVQRFLERATAMASTVERIASPTDIPIAVGRYLDALKLPPSLAMQASRSGVCWPEFAALDWPSAGLTIEARPTVGHDRIGITGSFCAIAETGTLVLISGEPWPIATALLPDTHFAVVRADRIVAGMEEAFALVRTERPAMPRGLHLVSGPSRTGDIEQTIVLGAHGPYRVHILLVG
ncbi:MAG: lactate utilization protein [Burkholderiales bacterium]